MKIAHVNTHTYGGAAIVARRIHLALLEIRINSILLTKFGVKGDFPSHFFLKDGRVRNFLLKIISNPTVSPLVEFLTQKTQHRNLVGRPKGFEIFSIPSTSTMPEMYDILKDFDIIHLHWTNDFFEYGDFFKILSNKKLVWTLHDMNPITGGCHHSDGCMKFESVCVQCPQLKNTINEDYSRVIQESKIEALKPIKDDQLLIVSPSSWLLELSKKSKITSRFRHILVPNPSFKTVTNPKESPVARQKLALPPDKKIIMFASGNLNNTRKGITLLFEAVRSISKHKDIILVGMGHKAKPQKGLEIIYTGSLSNPALIADYFQAADIFVTPTLAENSPLVVIESLCCGTPVVASNVGGIPDLVHSDNGILFETGNISSLAEAIITALFEKEFDREKIRTKATAVHAPLKIAKDYLSVYNSI